MSDPESVGVRPATPGDLDVLRRLYEAFHEFHVRGVPDRLRSPEGDTQNRHRELRAGLKDIIGRDDATLLVATTEDEVVGMAEVYVRHDELGAATFARTYGHLQSLMVLESCRRLGVGEQLLVAAQNWAGEQGATEMRLDTWEFESGPLCFYERRGYRTLKRTLVRELGERP